MPEQENGFARYVIVPIVVALIGMAASLGVAWIGTGKKFESELKTNRAKIQASEQTVATLNQEIQGFGARLQELEQSIAVASTKSAELNRTQSELLTKIQSTKAELTHLESRATNLRDDLQRLNINPQTLPRVR